MSKVLRVLLGLVGGYLAGAALGGAAIQLLSSNTHDKGVETAMTAAFVAGPIGALIGLVVAIMWRRRVPSAAP